MSEVKRYNFFIGGLGQEGRNADFVRADDHESQLAALREELASANADKDAYAQNAIDLRTSLDAVTLNLSRVDNTLFKTSQRLADAERRNAILIDALTEERRIRLLGQQPDIHWESLRDDRRACYAKTDAALTKPEEAKS